MTVLVVVGPGSMPVKASTVAVSSVLGLIRLNPSIGMPLEISDMIADHRGAEVSSEVFPMTELSELPIQMPVASAGNDVSDGGGRKP